MYFHSNSIFQWLSFYFVKSFDFYNSYSTYIFYVVQMILIRSHRKHQEK